MAGTTGARYGMRATRTERRVGLKGRRATFLSHLAANCNVKAAAQAARVPLSTLLGWRRMEPDFAASWAEAIALGYQMLEARLIAHALAGQGGDTLDGVDGTELEPLNIDLALRVMGMRRAASGKAAPAPAPRKPSPETALQVLLERIEKVEKRRRALDADAAPVLIEQSGEGGA